MKTIANGTVAVALAIVICANFAEALNISGGVWLVSENIVSNDALRMSLQETEMLVKSGEREKALKLIGETREETKDKPVVMKDGEDLPLVLDAMELYYKGMSDPEEATELLQKHKGKAKGKRYAAYKQLYQLLRKHYGSIKDYAKAAEVAKEAALYDPNDYVLILPIFEYAKDFPKECGELDTFLKEYSLAGGTLHEELKLSAILTRNDSPEAKMEKACEWLDRNRSSSEKALSRALPLITTLADAKHPKTITDYYYALTNLALKQPSNEERLTVFAMALNERQKLVAAAPEILPPKGN